MLYALRNLWPPYCACPEHVARVVALYYGYEQWSFEYIRRIRASVRYCVLHYTEVCQHYMSSCEYAVMPFFGVCISYSDRICMCHPIGQYHKTGMDELGYRRVFFRYLGGTKYLLRFMAYNDLVNLE